MLEAVGDLREKVIDFAPFLVYIYSPFDVYLKAFCKTKERQPQIYARLTRRTWDVKGSFLCVHLRLSAVKDEKGG